MILHYSKRFAILRVTGSAIDSHMTHFYPRSGDIKVRIKDSTEDMHLSYMING